MTSAIFFYHLVISNGYFWDELNDVPYHPFTFHVKSYHFYNWFSARKTRNSISIMVLDMQIMLHYASRSNQRVDQICAANRPPNRDEFNNNTQKGNKRSEPIITLALSCYFNCSGCVQLLLTLELVPFLIGQYETGLLNKEMLPHVHVHFVPIVARCSSCHNCYVRLRFRFRRHLTKSRIKIIHSKYPWNLRDVWNSWWYLLFRICGLSNWTQPMFEEMSTLNNWQSWTKLKEFIRPVQSKVSPIPADSTTVPRAASWCSGADQPPSDIHELTWST